MGPLEGGEIALLSLPSSFSISTQIGLILRRSATSVIPLSLSIFFTFYHFISHLPTLPAKKTAHSGGLTLWAPHKFRKPLLSLLALSLPLPFFLMLFDLIAKVA